MMARVCHAHDDADPPQTKQNLNVSMCKVCAIREVESSHGAAHLM